MRLMNRKTLRTLGGLLAAGIPVGYLIKKHIGWEQTPAGKLTMGIHQATFWTLATVGMVRVHRTYRLTAGPLRKLFRYGTSGLLMAGGFWGGEKLAAWLTPKLLPYEPAMENAWGAVQTKVDTLVNDVMPQKTATPPAVTSPVTPAPGARRQYYPSYLPRPAGPLSV